MAVLEVSISHRHADMKILLMAGEVSGDYQASFLAEELRAAAPDAGIFGTGGSHMRRAGVEIVHETAHMSSVGFLEPIRHVLPLHGIYRDMLSLVRRQKPDVAVLVDNQGFNLAVAKVLRRIGVPVIFYFPPQIWVGPSLFARTVGEVSRLVISAFPLEAQIYRERYGANAVSYGHPLLDIVKPEQDPDAALREAGLDPLRPVIGLMPGSRTQEVKELGRAMVEAAAIIAARRPGTQFVLPVAADHVRGRIQSTIREHGRGADIRLIDRDVYACLSRCELVMVCSGTATLELSLLGVPMVPAYRLDPVSHWVARKLSITPFVAMPNVLLGEMAVAEIIQYKITGENFAERALDLLERPGYAAEVRAKLARIPDYLGDRGAVRRAAARILDELRDMKSSGGGAVAGRLASA